MEETTQTTYPSLVRRVTLVIAAVIFAGIGALIAFGLFQLQNNPGNSPSTGDMEPAPDFTAPLYSGGSGDFTLSDHLGSPVVVNFWGSWCPPCRAEFPALQAVADEYKDRGLIVFGVDVQDTEENARAFLEEQDTTFLTGPDLTGQISLDYQVLSMPTTYFVTRDGKILRSWAGQIDEARLTTFIEEILNT